MTTKETEKDAIGQVVRRYVQGMLAADEMALRQAFHPECKIIGHFQGSLEWMSLDDFIGEINQAGPAAADTQPYLDIGYIDVTGDAASLKVVDDFAGLRFTDYLSLLKIDGRWTIINKLYYVRG